MAVLKKLRGCSLTIVLLLFTARCGLAQTVGFDPGEELPDLVYTTPGGASERISEHRGKIVFLHVLAAWCPPCGPELKDIEQLYSALVNEPGIEFVVCGWREGHQRTMTWAKKQWHVSIPINHTGSIYRRNRKLEFEDGFTYTSGVPLTWILGPNGIVITRKRGPYWDWVEHIEGLRNAAREVAGAPPVGAAVPPTGSD